ncbi:MAG: PHP domain-containing protein [Deltaproteobacteria bacterium]|nr:MAG: PHP domain-containing protein [Deltaproteobacteria bacterium]
MSRLILSCAAAALLAVAGCNDTGEHFARAYQAKAPDELVGGDVAMARVGDWVLENDKIRIAILDKDSSPAPGVFGGTFVDADLQRPEATFRDGIGADQLAEVIPVANLLWPRPDTGDVTLVADGSDGGAAIVRVSGEAAVFLETLSILKTLGTALSAHVDLRMETDYVLEPGASYVRIVTRVYRADVAEPTEPLPLPVVTDEEPILDTVLGNSADGKAPGMLAGDFVFFGARNDIFAPGIGFDENKPIFDALFEGRDTFTHPLVFDYMAAAGGPVSYGYFNVGDPGGAPPKVLVPIITSSSTGFVTNTLNCSDGSADDATCDAKTAWSFERYFVVGKGDIASVADIIYAARGVEVGTIMGVVRGTNGQPEANGHVFVFRDPDPTRDWADIYAAVDQNYRDTGMPGLMGAIDADVGRDPVEDGDYRATLPPGDYLVVAQNEARTSTSGVARVKIVAGETAVVSPVVPPPARVRFRITDGAGQLTPAKLSFVSVGADGERMIDDGLRRPYMGEGRLGNGVRFQQPTTTGDGVMEVEAGTYDLIASIGPEYSTDTRRLELQAGQEISVTLVLVHEVPTPGWVSSEFHVHAAPSFDSGMPLRERVSRVAAEGIDFVVATDHDVETDYGPTVGALNLHDRLQTSVGVEMSTLELGHFVAFPLVYDELAIPAHGAPDWTCLDGPGLLQALTDRIVPGESGVRIITHPRDGIIGYISQLELDPYDFTRSLGFLSASNTLLARTTCDFDAMEVFNSKRFDLIRTPTNAEVIRFNLCMQAIEASTSVSELEQVCPELTSGGPLASCPAGERLSECKYRFRRRAAYLVAGQILRRTPEEQVALWNHVPAASDEAACTPSRHPNGADPADADAPCTFHVGTYDEWMRWLDAGLSVTLTGGSDSHGVAREPGFPRNMVRSDAAVPGAIVPGEAATEVVKGHVRPTFGPMVDVSVGEATEGDIVTVSGETFALRVKIRTASWFGVDRLEVYVNGALEHAEDLDAGPTAIVDYDDTLTLPVPAKDGFVTVYTVGTREENLFGPVHYDVPFGELQLPRVAALALGANPILAAFTDNLVTPAIPDFFPSFPAAISNAIFLDVDGDGAWTPSDAPPPLCAVACDYGAADADAPCREGEVCLPTGDCGLAIEGSCTTGPPGTEDRAPNTWP